MGFPPNHRSFYDRCARRSGTVRASRRSGELSWTSTGLLALPRVKFPQQRKFPTAKRLMELPGTPHDYQINDGLQSAAACDQRDGHKLVQPQMFDDGRRFGLLFDLFLRAFARHQHRHRRPGLWARSGAELLRVAGEADSDHATFLDRSGRRNFFRLLAPSLP
jgi:hypothetical protein